ncbi:DUF2345 domain-containing protein, partial [Pseudomonas alvandae]
KITLNAGGSYITLDEGLIESGTRGDFVVKSANFEYVQEAAEQAAPLKTLPELAEHDARSAALTDFSG